MGWVLEVSAWGGCWKSVHGVGAGGGCVGAGCSQALPGGEGKTPSRLVGQCQERQEATRPGSVRRSFLPPTLTYAAPQWLLPNARPQPGVTRRDGDMEEREAEGPKLHLSLQSLRRCSAPRILPCTRGAGKQPLTSVQSTPSRGGGNATTGSSQGLRMLHHLKHLQQMNGSSV